MRRIGRSAHDTKKSCGERYSENGESGFVDEVFIFFLHFFINTRGVHASLCVDATVLFETSSQQ